MSSTQDGPVDQMRNGGLMPRDCRVTPYVTNGGSFREGNAPSAHVVVRDDGTAAYTEARMVESRSAARLSVSYFLQKAKRTSDRPIALFSGE